MFKKLVGVFLLVALLVGMGATPLLAVSTVYDTAIVDGVQYLPGDTYWANTHTEVEYLGDGSFGATITVGPRVFFDKADGNNPKKHKLTDERPAKDYILIQSAKCAVEIYPYYARYFDVQHEEVRVYEERWVVQRLFKEPDTWRDVDAYNPVISIEEYSHPSGDVVKVTVSFDTDYGDLTVEYFQGEGNNLKHNVTFNNTSGSTQTFRVLQKWAGIVGNKVEHRNSDGQVVTSTITSMEVIDSPAFRFLKDDGSLSVFENQSAMFFDNEGRKLLTQNIKPVEVDVHAQGMKADFIFGNWVLSQNESLEIDPDTATLDNPTEDGNLENQWDTKETGSQELQWGLFSPTTIDFIYRAYVEWDVSGIGVANVTDTVFKYEGHTHNVNCTNTAIKAILNHQPSTHPSGGGAGQSIEVFDEIGTSTAYVASDATMPVVAQNQSVDLGASADTDLESQISGGWFAIGFKTQETENPPNFATWLHKLKSEDNVGPAVPKPTLYVVYTPLVVPTVTTQAVTNIADTTATGNGNITATGGENCDKRGIVYGTTTQGDPGGVAPPATYDDFEEETDGFGTGAFTRSLTGLSPGQIYYVRAYAHNSAGYNYGGEVNFYTLPSDPSNFSATTISDTQIDLGWTKGTGGDKTMVRRAEGAYPANPAVGDQVYFDTGVAHSDMGRDPSTLYYYRAWAYDTDSGDYSSGFSQDTATTYGPPSVTTNAASLVEETTATLNGEITAINGANAITRGFEWDIDSGAPYANDWHEDGSFGVASFNHAIASLNKGDVIYFRAYAINTYGTGYGSEVTLLTKPDPPNTFVATGDTTQIDFTWVKGTGSTKTYIRGKDGSYPADRTDGYLVYDDTLELCSDTGLTGGHTYYYKAWGHAEGSDSYSDTFDFDYASPAMTLQLWIEWEYDTTFTDLSGEGHDATPTFRTSSSDADVIATATSFKPITQAKAPTWSLSDDVATWLVAPSITGNFTTTPGPTFPGSTVITDIATGSGTPAQLPFTMITAFITLAASLVVSYVMRKYGSGSLFVKGFVIWGFMLIWLSLDIHDLWMMLFFIIPALAIMAANKQGALI